MYPQAADTEENHLDEILAKNLEVVHYVISLPSAVLEPGSSVLENFKLIHKNGDSMMSNL